MVKKILILAILILATQNITLATTTCATRDANGNCKINHVQVRNLGNGYSQIKTNIGGQTIYGVERSYDAQMLQSIMNAGLNMLPELAKEEKRLTKIAQANAKIITKKTSITTAKGVKISLEEDKNGDDFLVINNQRTKIANNLVNQQLKSELKNKMSYSVQDPYETIQNNSKLSLYELYRQEQVQNIRNRSKQESYAEFISKNQNIDGFLKIIYNLRDKYGVSYSDAQKLMAFRNDNSNFNPEDLLLPVEISKNNYKIDFQQAQNKFKNITFPKI